MASRRVVPAVSLWRRALWVGLGACCILAAIAFAQVLTPDVGFTIEDGVEYSEGGLFGNFLHKIGYFFLGAAIFIPAALGFAAYWNGEGPDYPGLGRKSLVGIGPLLVVLLVFLRGPFEVAIGLFGF